MAAASLLGAAACSGYRAVPLQPDAEWARLESVRLQDLIAPSAPADGRRDEEPGFDSSDGLSPDEAASVALALNPDLRVFRAEKGVAEGQLREARLLPNPEFDGGWTNLAGTVAGELDLLVDLTEALVTRGPRTERAKARLAEMQWEVADREWQLRNDVRAAWISLAYAEEAIALLRSQAGVAERTVAALRNRQAAGASTELEVVVAESEVASLRGHERRLAGGVGAARQRLNALLGLPPNNATPLERVKESFRYAPIGESEMGDAAQLPRRRPDLRAKEKAYLVAEKELQGAFRRRWGRLGLGPSADTSGGSVEGGLALSFVIPLFNLNQGEIAVRAAERLQRHEAYVAQLHRARAELHLAWADWNSLDAELSVLFSDLAPRLDRSILLAETALREGELDLLQVLLLQSRALQNKREVLERLREFHLASIEVDRARGPAPLEDAP